ncbi:hypothetical protein PSAG_04901, partial [Fusobacterium animalis D11]
KLFRIKNNDTQLKEREVKDITLIGIAFFGKIIKVNYQIKKISLDISIKRDFFIFEILEYNSKS